MSHEPSMEEILSSIKKIIADDGEKPVGVPRVRRALSREVADTPSVETATATADTDGDVLELTEAMHDEPDETPSTAPVAAPSQPQAPAQTQSADAAAAESLVAEKSVLASRNALAQLSKAKVKPVAAPQSPTDNAIEALVMETMRPMLKTWLDANLPRIVEAMVAKEIARLRD